MPEIEILFDIYYPDEEVDYRYYYTGRILSHFKWFDQVVEQSDNEGISLIQGLHGHAAYQFWQDDQKDSLVRNQSYYEMKIRNNEDWMKKIRIKAKESKISVEEQVKLEAAWTLSNSK